MRNIVALIASPLVLLTVQIAQGADQLKIPMTADRWTPIAGKVEFVDHMGVPSVDLKPGNFAEHKPSGQAVLNGLIFRNGTIEYDVDAASGMGAGFAFRRSDKDNYEDFYLRPQPKCDQAPGCVQYTPQSHGVLLWDLFPQYQSPAPLRQGEWNHVKLVISGQRKYFGSQDGFLYSNGAFTNLFPGGVPVGINDFGEIALANSFLNNDILLPDGTLNTIALPAPAGFVNDLNNERQVVGDAFYATPVPEPQSGTIVMFTAAAFLLRVRRLRNKSA